MKISVLSPNFLEDVRKYVERELNYEWSWKEKGLVRNDEPFVTVAEILDFEDFTYYGGYCETCSYEEAHCRITFKTGSGVIEDYEYTGSFTDLINDLVRDND